MGHECGRLEDADKARDAELMLLFAHLVAIVGSRADESWDHLVGVERVSAGEEHRGT